MSETVRGGKVKSLAVQNLFIEPSYRKQDEEPTELRRGTTNLLGSDAADDALLHPVDHVLLFHPAVEVLQGDLVVQAPLHLIGDHV